MKKESPIFEHVEAGGAKEMFVQPTPDYHYAELVGEHLSEAEEEKKRENEKKAILKKLWAKYFPPEKQRELGIAGLGSNIETHGNYFYFPMINWRNNEDAFYEALFSSESLLETTPFTKASKKLAEHVPLLAQEYKIHLMPKAEFVPFVLEKLFSTLRDNADFRHSISEIKTRARIDGTGRLPTIVVYLQLGKEYAQRVLDQALASFESCESIGTGQTPRFNRKINDLIYYAQSSGDLKEAYFKAAKRAGKDPSAETIFDQDMAHFRGDYQLQIPEKK